MKTTLLFFGLLSSVYSFESSATVVGAYCSSADGAYALQVTDLNTGSENPDTSAVLLEISPAGDWKMGQIKGFTQYSSAALNGTYLGLDQSLHLTRTALSSEAGLADALAKTAKTVMSYDRSGFYLSASGPRRNVRNEDANIHYTQQVNFKVLNHTEKNSQVIAEFTMDFNCLLELAGENM